MGYVKSPEEIARMQTLLATPRFVGAEVLALDFLTRTDLLAALLPPGLEPTGEPIVTVRVGRWRSNCVGDFTGATVGLAARHGELNGAYILAMFMNSDHSMLFGRDLFGEPKKLAVTALHRQGNTMHGYVERCGVRLIDIRATLGSDIGGARSTVRNFNVKATPSCTGIGCEDDPVLTLAEFDTSSTVRRPGEGRIILRSTVHDPLDDLEVRSVRSAMYMEADIQATCRPLARLSASAFLPYLYGRQDYWPALSTEETK